jgi:hypothetical protein
MTANDANFMKTLLHLRQNISLLFNTILSPHNFYQERKKETCESWVIEK